MFFTDYEYYLFDENYKRIWHYKGRFSKIKLKNKIKEYPKAYLLRIERFNWLTKCFTIKEIEL